MRLRRVKRREGIELRIWSLLSIKGDPCLSRSQKLPQRISLPFCVHAIQYLSLLFCLVEQALDSFRNLLGIVKLFSLLDEFSPRTDKKEPFAMSFFQKEPK
jgi:hypothetical protein